MKKLQIENFIIGKEKTFIIAEIGNNHNGNFDNAIKLIDQCKEIGVDAVKFQMRDLNSLYREKSLKKSGEDLGTEYILDLLNRFELKTEEHFKIFNYCKKINLIYICTPWDVKSLNKLERFGVNSYKVASADLTNMPLLCELVLTKKPLIISTGMSLEIEIENTVRYLNKFKTNFALLHCNSTYPAPFHDINLTFLKRLKKIHSIIGYSGHERGISVSLAAVGLGAKIIERHITLDRSMEGPDHVASLTKKEFKELVVGIREVDQAIGNEKKREMSQGEMINRENLGKSLVASRSIKQGSIVKQSDIKVMSPGQGLSPQYSNKLIGKKLNRDIQKEDFFFQSDLNSSYKKPKKFSFNRPWGVPVRYHDFSWYNSQINPDIWEFHLSYSDMELDINKYFKNQNESNFLVHAPELFSNSHLMDLASFDENYRKKSIKETQKVIEITKSINKFFPNTIKPKIIANIGGFSIDKPLDEKSKLKAYTKFSLSLKELNLDEVELLPQTMAPFPWHFGGQRYQNLFVNVEEIIYWGKELKLNFCFDISHSFLTCNYTKFDFYEFADLISPFTSHLHMGDAKGFNGEGLQIGEGEINFKKLCKILNQKCKRASFIPEIWQGHKDNGKGFWKALNHLEGIL